MWTKIKLGTVLWLLTLLTLVTVSVGILQLSFRNVYWRDSVHSGTTELLGVLQVAAKAHELLIVYSLSQIVLHYLRARLSSLSGLPFGLFVYGYSNTLGQLPLALGFWESLVSAFWKIHFQWRPFAFGLLVLLATFIGLTAGPASAIALIPQLRWWHGYDLLNFADINNNNHCDNGRLASDVSFYLTKQLFPKEVSSTSLPGAFCLDTSLDARFVCPYQGLNDLSTLNFTGTNNLTIGARIGRVVATDRTNYEVRAWTVSQLVTNFLSHALVISDTLRSVIAVEAHSSKSPTIPSPVTNVTCRSDISTTYLRNLNFFVRRDSFGYGKSYGASPDSSEGSFNETFDIRNIWDEDLLRMPQTTSFEWREFKDADGNVLLAGFILSSGGSTGLPRVSICSVFAQWAPVKLSVLPSQGRNLVSNFTFDEYDGT